MTNLTALWKKINMTTAGLMAVLAVCVLLGLPQNVPASDVVKLVDQSAGFAPSPPAAAAAQPPASAQPAPPEPLRGFSIPSSVQDNLSAPEYLAHAEENFLTGDYEMARGYFMKAIPLLEDDADKARAHERLAFVYSALGLPDETYREFLESLKLDQSISLDQDQVSPQVYEAFRKAQGEIIREGTLVCNCDPAGAEVYLDGVLLGEAPARKERIKEGEHLLILKKQGYETSVSKVTIKKGVTLTIEDKMSQASGEITVMSEPPGAAVIIDGLAAGTTPATLKKVAGGRHEVIVRRDYFEPARFEVEMEVAGKKELHASLRRRLLFVGLTEGAQPDGMGLGLEGLARDMRSKMGGLEVAASGLDELGGKLAARGLDPASLGFLRRHKPKLELEDIAVLSGVLEQERAELMLVAFLHAEGPKRVLDLTLYSIAGNSGDRTTITSDSDKGLEEGFEGYLWKWSRQEKPLSATIGARLADRADGTVEVESVLPGYPASAAGIQPGDRIAAVDAVKVSGKDSVMSWLKPGTEQQINVTRRDGSRAVKITSVYAPVETPPGSGDYLYNLALIEYSGAGTDPLAMLNLGNVYMHMGEYEKAVKAYKAASGDSKAGVCTGTALFRLGQACEKLMRWVDAAGAYRKAMLLYPEATLESAEGPSVAALAKERLKQLFAMDLVSERWWL